MKRRIVTLLSSLLVLSTVGCRPADRAEPRGAATRIVTLAPSLTEYVLALGAGAEAPARPGAKSAHAECMEAMSNAARRDASVTEDGNLISTGALT